MESPVHLLCWLDEPDWLIDDVEEVAAVVDGVSVVDSPPMCM